MAETSRKWQMDCCLCCGCPFQPSGTMVRKGTLGARSLNYIEEDAQAHAKDWGLPGNRVPNLISEKQDLHIVHKSDCKEPLDALINGALCHVWLNDPTPGYHADQFRLAPVPRNKRTYPHGDHFYDRNVIIDGRAGGGDIILPQTNKKKKSFYKYSWAPPPPLLGARKLHKLLRKILTRTNGGHKDPNFDMVIAGCKQCNTVSTQKGSSSNYLIRLNISPTPLVGTEVMCAQEVEPITAGIYAGTYNVVDIIYNVGWFPNDETRNGMDCHYSAAMAYYTHRTLPTNIFTIPNDETGAKLSRYRKLNVFISYLMLMAASSIYQRYYGANAGEDANPQPVFRYQACAELYISVMFWMLAVNDRVMGSRNGADAPHCTMDFPIFHLYLFTEIPEVVRRVTDSVIDSIEIRDCVFSPVHFPEGAGDSGMLFAGGAQVEQDKTMGYMFRCVSAFYSNLFRPIFSRHFAGLNPDPTLLNPDNGNDLLHYQQESVREALVDVDSINAILHLLEGATIGNPDSFIEIVGVKCVFCKWIRMMRTAPTRTRNLLQNYVQCMVQIEYDNIRRTISMNGDAPMISKQTANLIYSMCYALNMDSLPTQGNLVELLLQSETRSDYAAVLALIAAGATNYIDLPSEDGMND